MGQIKVSKCPIEGLYIIEPAVHGDNRGYFMETYNQNDMHEAGLDMVFVQHVNERCAARAPFPEGIPPGKACKGDQRKGI